MKHTGMDGCEGWESGWMGDGLTNVWKRSV